jgi:outer membrane protein OmpA-like peptidoglycan-associated protein
MMKKRLLLVLSIVLGAVFANAQSLDLSRGDRMIEHKAYAQAANYFAKYADVSVQAKLKLARCQYWMKEPLVCANVYAKVQADSLKDVDRYYYADVLWQLGKEDESRAVGKLIKNDILKSVVDGFQNFESDSLLLYSKENTTVERMNLNPDGSAFGGYWHKGQFYYVSNSKKPSLIDEASPNDSATYLDISMKGDGSPEMPLKKINSSRHEGSIAMNKDNNHIVMTRTVSSGFFTSVEQPQLFELKLKENGKWSRPKKIKFCNDEFSYAHASFSKDGKAIYFVSNQPGGTGGFDVYSSTMMDGKWGVPALLNTRVNSEYDELFTSVSEDYLFFSSNRKGGVGAFDLYAYNIKEGTIDHLPAPINSRRDDFALNSNGTDSVWFVSSNRNFQVGKDEILQLNYPTVKEFMYVYNKETEKLIRNTPAKIPSATGTWADAGIDRSGKIPPYMQNGDSIFVYGYYPHQIQFLDQKGIKRFLRKHSKNQLQPIKEILLDVAIPIEVAQVSGEKTIQVVNKNGAFKNVETITAERTKAAVLPFSSVQVGDSIQVNVYKGDTLLATTYEVIKLNNIYRANDVKVIEKNWTGDVFIKDSTAVQKNKYNLFQNLKSIYFATNKWFISPSAKRELSQVINYMKENPTVVIECASHADCRATKEYNLKLSEQRAKATADYIIRHGISKDRVKHKGYGEEQPVNGCVCEGQIKTTCTAKELQLNRRTDFLILKK